MTNKENFINDKDYALYALAKAVGDIMDALQEVEDTLTPTEIKEVLYELGWTIGELSACGGAIADEIGEDFRDYIH